MRTTNIVSCGLCAALTAVLSQLAIPVGTVPISFATLGVMLSAGMLGEKWGTFSQAVYLLIGTLGLPVFHGMQGGIGVLLGPTGGFLIGYVLLAWMSGMMLRKRYSFAVSMACGTAICYLTGSVWFWMLTRVGMISILTSCVVPFLPGDVLKIFLAAQVCRRFEEQSDSSGFGGI